MTDGGRNTFIDLPAASLNDLAHGSRVGIVVMGASEASPYKAGEPSHSADAPREIRRASRSFAASLGQFDFDLGATMFPDRDDHRGMVDLGDIETDASDPDRNRQRIEATVRATLEAGAIPVMLGGDDSVPIPMLRAYEGHGPLTILQIDAHVDWGDVIQGNPLGYGSTMRRASEYAWVRGMVQIGIRGLGSGASWQHDDARRWGSRIVTSYDLHAKGLDVALASVPADRPCFISIDVDGLDPAVLPAVAMPTPGGLTFENTVGLIRGVAAKTPIVGLALVEYVPARDDSNRLSALTVARIGAVTMGLIAEQRR